MNLIKCPNISAKDLLIFFTNLNVFKTINQSFREIGVFFYWYWNSIPQWNSNSIFHPANGTLLQDESSAGCQLWITLGNMRKIFIQFENKISLITNIMSRFGS